MTISNTTNIKGLYTFGNELTQPEGSLEIADNVNIDENSVITPRRGFGDVGQPLSTPSQRFKQLMSYKKTAIRHYGTTLEWENGPVFSQFAGVYDQLDPDIRIKFQESNSNLYFTTKNGIMKISAKKVSDFSTNPNYITPAGIPRAVDVFGTPVYGSTGFLPPQSKVAYKVLFGKKDVNNNVILGTASARFVVSNTSRDVFTFEKTYFEFKEDENFLAERTTLTCSTKNNTTETNGNNSYVLISNAENANKYILYFDKGAAVAPSVIGFTNIRVDISGISTGDPVAPSIITAITTFGGLEGVNVTRVNNDITFTNLFPGLSDGVRTPTNNPAVDIGGGWDTDLILAGTDSKYIRKYFTVQSKTNKYCFYYGNPETIDDVPTDPGMATFTKVGILITNTSPKSYIANQTSQTMLQVLRNDFTVELTTSGINPIIALTDVNGGDIPDVSQGTITSSIMTVSVVNQGTITEGQNANVSVTFTVPNNVDETFFFRIYRTPYQSAEELDIPFDAVDPGEECYLVYEEAVPSSAGSKITILDITPETFRQAGEPLYSNLESGDGTTQSNDQPPIAKDICNYQGYTFYSNTSTFNRTNLDLISVDGFVSESTKIVIANGNFSTYTLRGEAKETEITCGTKANTLIHSISNPDSIITMYSASDETKYIVYFDDGTGSTPVDTDAILIKVNITELAPTDNVATTLATVLGQFPDFEIQADPTTVFVTNSENGAGISISTPNSPTTDLGTGWSFNETVPGIGEDVLTGHVLLSKSASVGIKLERTARSLVDVINGDTNSVINAYYVSGQNDIPGKMLLEAKNLSDGTFYVAIIEGSPTNFIPEVPLINSTGITDIAAYLPTQAIIEVIGHDFVDNEQVYFNFPETIPQIKGTFSVDVIDVDHVVINATFVSGDADNSLFFFPYNQSDNLAVSNRLMFSKRQQPEAVPTLNYIDIGTRDEPIERILALRDYLFVIKTDGIFMLSGNDYRYFTVRLLDTEKIACPDSAVVLNNQIYMLSDSAILSINESTPSIISRMIENKVNAILDENINYRRLGFGVSYDNDRSYMLWVPTDFTDTVCTQCFRYNFLERTWSRWTKTATCGLTIGDTPRLYIGDGDKAYTMKERKKLDRTDHSDRDFEVTFSFESLIDNRYRLSDTSEIEVGDVVVQSQLIAIDFYNSFLRKLDLDTGLPSTDYEALFSCATGDNLASKLTSLNIRLRDEDTSDTVTIHVFNNLNWESMRTAFNLLIDELNDIDCITKFKDYVKSTRNVNYEYIITSVNQKTSEVIFNDETNIIQGTLVVYKQIKTQIRFNPIHFGNASSWKQVNYGYVLFDQNNFYRMKVEYNSDLSAYFEGKFFFGKGVGFWDSNLWGFGSTNNYWGGSGNDAPERSIIPRNKQRCRYIRPQIFHNTARDYFRIVGVAHNIREFSERAYKGL